MLWQVNQKFESIKFGVPSIRYHKDFLKGDILNDGSSGVESSSYEYSFKIKNE